MRTPANILALVLMGGSACSFLTAVDTLRGGDASVASDAGDASVSDAISDANADAPKLTTYRAVVLADTPKSYWRLGEKAVDASTKDEIGPNLGIYGAGVKLGAPGAIVGDPDTAVFFDGGSSGVITFNDIFTFSGKTPHSVEAWVRPTAYPNGAYVVDRLAGCCPSDGWWIAIGTSGQAAFVRLNSDAGPGNVVVTPQPLPLGTFAHVVATYDGTDMAIHVNGLRVYSLQNATAGSAKSAIFAIGNAWVGSIDEVAIYDYALSESKIMRHFQVGSGIADF